ncbi:MAG: MBL fold metallo-hydrolase [Promethearchaeota archaeon]
MLVRQYVDEEVVAFKMGRGFAGVFLFPVYAYLVGDSLVDSGPTLAGRRLVAALRGFPVSRVLNTHPHEDHFGNNALLVEKFGCVAFAHERALPVMLDPSKLELRSYQRFAWGTPPASPPEATKPLPPRVTAGDWEFEVLETPGHDPGHACFFEGSRGWLFSGDLHVGKTSLEFQPRDDFHEILASLKLLERKDPDVAFCSHQGRIDDAREALRRKMEAMEAVRDEILELSGAGLDERKVARRALGRESPLAWITRGHLSKLNVVRSALRRRS